MFTIGAHAQDVDLADALTALDALTDAHLFVSGDDLRVPPLNKLLWVCGGLASGGTTRMNIQAPSLRDMNNIEVRPLNGMADADVEPSDPIAILDMSNAPRTLETDEILQCLARSDSTAAAFQWAVYGFGDGPVQPATGEIITVHATGATTLTARAWTAVTLTFTDRLQAGNYQVVGMRAFSASAIAARCVFKSGGTNFWRPGCIGVDSHATMDYPLFRVGRSGVWGEFNQTVPPDIEFLADLADTAQQVELDLIKVG